ncbi:MAG TPA: histidine kinase [Cytophagales bacterium]|nr:histidine kinase [Cytophagales bacterium]
MNNLGWVIGFSLGYLTLLFALAWWGERRAQRGRSLVSNPYVYALSLAVYCTAWTYYGSVGRAANNGIEFLTIYLGPTLTAPLWWIILRKAIRICRVQRITTLADFISARYGQSLRLSYLVTIVCVLGIVPYIALQLKAIGSSFEILTSSSLVAQSAGTWYQDSSFYITLVLGVFIIVFGSKPLDVTRNHEGMVVAVAFESIVKLVAFLVVGSVITFGLFRGFGDIFQQAQTQPALQRLFVMDEEVGFSRWFWMLMVSMFAFLLLPRQFQVAVLENRKESNLRKAIWLFPLYLLLINIFVLPIAFAGRLTFPLGNVDADTFVLTLPLWADREGLALLAYLGGFSAATSMIIVSTIALSRMISHNVLVPYLVGSKPLTQRLGNYFGRILIASRRVNIILLLLLAYLYHRFVASSYSLVSIGLISFAAVAQFAPALLGGMYWKGGTKQGATAGIVVGFLIWGFTLVLPTLVGSGLMAERLMEEGLWGISILRPYQFLGLQTMEPLAHGVFWSLFWNLGAYVAVSIFTMPSSKEQNQAEVFIEVFKYSEAYDISIGWKGRATVDEIRRLLEQFLGHARSQEILAAFAQTYQVDWNAQTVADARLVNYAERMLAESMGRASARVLLATTLKEEEITLEEVHNLLRESQHLVSVNQELRQKSEALREASEALQQANAELKMLDGRKDDFISTVTHEMRTPLTGIRAMSEILADNPDLEGEERDNFLHTIIGETERMNRLISQVLDLEKMDSGKMSLHKTRIQLNEVIREAVESFIQVIKEKEIALQVDLQGSLPPVVADRDRMTQVILNLLSNAVKFVEPGVGKIVITSYFIDGEIRVRVSDNGKGIAPEIQSLIFDKFYQVENQTVRKPIGSGLGLAICQRILLRHQGRIWVESTPGEGARFSFALPAEPIGRPANPTAL